MIEFFPGIEVDPAIQFGKPVIAGTRVPVDVVVGNIAAGNPLEEVMDEYALTKDQILTALKYAARVLSEETVLAR